MHGVLKGVFLGMKLYNLCFEPGVNNCVTNIKNGVFRTLYVFSLGLYDFFPSFLGNNFLKCNTWIYSVLHAILFSTNAFYFFSGC